MKPVLSNAYFDMETLGYNPHEPKAKIVLAQVRYEGENHLIEEWRMNESNLIRKLFKIFLTFPKYTPVFTYNGGFDFNYLFGRISNLKFDVFTRIAMHHVFLMNIKHCDLLQFDGGYFVPLHRIARKNGYPLQSKYDGSHIERLYKNKDYDSILEHGIEDIEVLEKLTENTILANRFLRDEILTWTERKWKR